MKNLTKLFFIAAFLTSSYHVVAMEHKESQEEGNQSGPNSNEHMQDRSYQDPSLHQQIRDQPPHTAPDNYNVTMLPSQPEVSSAQTQTQEAFRSLPVGVYIINTDPIELLFVTPDGRTLPLTELVEINSDSSNPGDCHRNN